MTLWLPVFSIAKKNAHQSKIQTASSSTRKLDKESIALFERESEK